MEQFMQSEIRVLLVGVGGYGRIYLDPLLDPTYRPDIRLVGAVDPFAGGTVAEKQLVAAGIPLYDSVEDFYAEMTADLALIATPIHLHRQQTISCLEHGSHVLCEKPAAALIDDVHEIIEVRDRTGKYLSIGYQWSHSAAIQGLKRDVLAGRYGELQRMKTIVLWPRNDDYYSRGSGWAGKKKTADGAWILDSVASNATAHYLHNMFYVAGAAISESAPTKTLEVETYRANPIEMYDTAAMRVTSVDGVEMLYIVSHAIEPSKVREPEFVFEFTGGRATARIDEGGIRIRGSLNDGTELDYGFPNAHDIRKIEVMVDLIRGEGELLCGIEAAAEHTKCINLSEELIPNTPSFPDVWIKRDESNRMTYVADLDQMLGRAYDEWKWPGERGIEGFEPAKRGDLLDYDHFRS